MQSIDLNNNRPVPMLRQKHLLNRRGSIRHNQFKGVRKELIEKQASQIIHTMTVGFVEKNNLIDDRLEQI